MSAKDSKGALMRETSPSHRGRLRLVVGLAAVLGLLAVPSALAETDDPIAAIEEAIVPLEGTETGYAIPLSLKSLPTFVGWWYTLVPEVEDDPRYEEALSVLVAPCCDDNSAFRCCCEQGGQACNIIRSGKGLAAYLIAERNFTTEAISQSVLEWFRFAKPDYYVAAELAAEGMSPVTYGLTTEGSCYRGMCEVPITQGGCGGMKTLIEPAIEGTKG